MAEDPYVTTVLSNITPTKITFTSLKEYDPDYTFTNLIPNAKMNTGWNYSSVSSRDPDLETNGIIVENPDCIYIYLSGTTSTPEVLLTNNTYIALDSTHKYYVRIYGFQKTKIAGASVGCYWPIQEPSVFEGYAVKDAGKWQMYSGVNTRNTFTTGSYQLRFDFNNNKTAGGIYFACPMLIDLTATFGAGKEPTKDWCDTNIPFTISSGNIYLDKPTSIKYGELTANELIETGTVTQIFTNKIQSEEFIEN